MKHVVVSAAIILGVSHPLPGLHAQATGTIIGVVTTQAVGARPIITSSKDPILHKTNAITERGRGLFNVAMPVPGIRSRSR